MRDAEVTSWTLIHGAAGGQSADRDEFARRYVPIIHAYLAARWRNAPALGDRIDDAAQEVMFECFKGGGVLDKADADRPGGFRAFLYGVVRNIARSFESRRKVDRERQMSTTFARHGVVDDGDTPPQAFDKAWARAVMKEAAERQLRRARAAGKDALRRAELLSLRFDKGQPIRRIAADWKVDAAWLHHEYATARREFRQCVEAVVRSYHAGNNGAMRSEWERLLSALA